MGGIMTGKSLRLRRVMDVRSGRTLVVPLDHGVSMGAIPGLEDLSEVVVTAGQQGANAVILHKGSLGHLVARAAGGPFDELGVVVHLSGATSLSPAPAHQVSVCSVDEAVALGADAVSVQVNLGCAGERDMLCMLAEVGRQAARHGVPLLVMAYVRDDAGRTSLERGKVVHAARVAEDLGADLVKLPFAGAETVAKVAAILHVPILIAGGAKGSEAGLYRMARDAMQAGAAGLCVGRNVFQAERPGVILGRLADIVHGIVPRAETVCALAGR
jgi:DhnA family fructose-bisphosphate aldolase class Ia